MEKASDVLKAGRYLIDRPEKWCQRRNTEHRLVWLPIPHKIEAHCSAWALDRVASLDRVAMGGTGVWAHKYLEIAMDNDICPYNDTHSHPEVMAAWDRAILLAEEDERRLAKPELPRKESPRKEEVTWELTWV